MLGNFKTWTQQLRTERYLSALTTLKNTGTSIAASAVVASGSLSLVKKGAILNSVVSSSTLLNNPVVGGFNYQNSHDTLAEMAECHEELDLADEMGDFVIQRRDGQVAYQLASCLDDLDWQMNLLIRGIDLRPSTAAQSSCFDCWNQNRLIPRYCTLAADR